MPVTKTATRALRQTKNRTKKNKIVRAKVKDLVKKAKSVAAKKQKPSENMLANSYKMLDKAARKNIIHPNKAARLKSRISKSLANAAK